MWVLKDADCIIKPSHVGLKRVAFLKLTSFSRLACLQNKTLFSQKYPAMWGPYFIVRCTYCCTLSAIPTPWQSPVWLPRVTIWSSPKPGSGASRSVHDVHFYHQGQGWLLARVMWLPPVAAVLSGRDTPSHICHLIPNSPCPLPVCKNTYGMMYGQGKARLVVVLCNVAACLVN